jgi:hypothetical protein
MVYEKTDYFNSNAPRANGVSFARTVQQETQLNELSDLQASANEITGISVRDEQWYRNLAISAQVGNMELSMTA